LERKSDGVKPTLNNVNWRQEKGGAKTGPER